MNQRRPVPASCLLPSALQGLGKHCIKVELRSGRGRERGWETVIQRMEVGDHDWWTARQEWRRLKLLH